MTNCDLRPLQREDIAAVQAIDLDAHGSAWSHRTFVDEVEQPNRIHLVAESANALVGHAAVWLDGDCCRVTNVAVAEDHHGSGHATTLLLAVIERALAAQRVANMQLEVRASNRRAQRLYGRFGFVPVGVERDFYDRADAQGSRDALVMAVTDVCADAWRQRLEELKADHAPTPKNKGAAA